MNAPTRACTKPNPTRSATSPARRSPRRAIYPPTSTTTLSPAPAAARPVARSGTTVPDQRSQAVRFKARSGLPTLCASRTVPQARQNINATGCVQRQAAHPWPAARCPHARTDRQRGGTRTLPTLRDRGAGVRQPASNKRLGRFLTRSRRSTQWLLFATVHHREARLRVRSVTAPRPALQSARHPSAMIAARSCHPSTIGSMRRRRVRGALGVPKRFSTASTPC